MEGQHDCYVAGTLAEMLRISRVGGLAPLKFVKKGTGWRVSLSPGWIYYSYFIATFIIITSIVALVIDLTQKPEESVRMTTTTRRVVWLVDALCMLLMAGIFVYGAPGQMRTMFNCLNRIGKINLELNLRYWPMHCEKTKKRFFFFWMLVTTMVLTTVDLVMLVNSAVVLTLAQKWVFGLLITYDLCYWILQLREINFVIVTLHVMYCFRSINDGLKTLLRKSLQKKPNNPESVRRLALAYTDTCDVVRDMDRAHGLIVLMMLASFLLHLICSPYYLITSILQALQNSNVDWTKYLSYVVLQLVWCTYHFVGLLMVIEPCHLTQMEMTKTSELVSHLIHSTETVYDPFSMELEIFQKHLFLNKASYSAMNVTTISRPLIATILGSITTYLVIVIQL